MGSRSPDLTTSRSTGANLYVSARDGKTDAVQAAINSVGTMPDAAAPWRPGTPSIGSRPSPSLAELLEYKDPKTGLTPLMIAVQHGHEAVVEQLLVHGAQVDATSAKGRTALMRAVKGNSMMFPMDIHMVDLLLQAGACPFSADNKGWTALGYALQRRASMGLRVPQNFELVLRSLLRRATWSGPLEIKSNRLLGLTKGWRRVYGTLVPFHFHVGAPATEVQLILIDETSLSLFDRLWVTNARGVTCTTRARLHIDLIVPRKQKMSDVFTSETTEHEMKLQLRALDDSLAESQRLNKLVSMAGLDPEEAEVRAQRRRLAAGLTTQSLILPATPNAHDRGRRDSSPDARQMSAHSMGPRSSSAEPRPVRSRFDFDVEASSVPTLPASFLRRDQVPATLAASREALGIAGIPDATNATESPPVVAPSSRQLRPLALRSDSARLDI